MFEKLFNILDSVSSLSDEVKKTFANAIKVKQFSKKEFLLREGVVCDYIYFIEKGLIRSYYSIHDDEVTAWFMKENDFIISVKSFFTRQPSYENMEALEDTTVYCMHYNDLEEIYAKYPQVNLNGRLLTVKYYILSEERLYFIRKQKAEDRYKLLLSVHPEILQRAPLKYIASYLGVTMETLSRIRARK